VNSWWNPGETIIGQLRRPAEGNAKPTASADWMVLIRPLVPGSSSAWSVVSRWGKTGANRPQEKVLFSGRSKSESENEARMYLDEKLRDERYQRLSGIISDFTARLAVSAEIKLKDWDSVCIRLAPLGLTATSDKSWEAGLKGTEKVLFQQSGDRVYVSGFLEVGAGGIESRPLFAAIAICTGGRIANSTGDSVELTFWVNEVKEDLSQVAYDVAADFGLLPKKIDYARLAENVSAGPWASLI